MTTEAAATVTAEASIGRLRATVAELAADVYTGRRVGTPGGRAAATWLATQLRELGAEVTRDSFPVGVRELYTIPVLRWNGRSLVHRRDFVAHLASADLAEPLIGRLGSETEPTWAGRWIVATDANTDLVERATAEGAHGLLVPRGTDSEGWMPKMIAGPAPVDLPVIAVRSEVHAQLRSDTDGSVAASMPLRSIIVTGSNVHGVVMPTPPSGPSVLLTAHYDGVGDDPEARLPAAADNASGVAAVLEATRLLASEMPPSIGLAVALLDGEEAGARGSAQHAPQVLAGTYVLNLDGAGQLSDAAAVEAGGPAQPLLDALDAAGREIGLPLRAGAMPSDNRRYAAVGLPAVGVGMGIPGYQTPAETPDRVDPATLIAATRLLVATVRHLAAS